MTFENLLSRGPTPPLQRVENHPKASDQLREIGRSGTPCSVRRRDSSARRIDTLREMEATDWALLNDQDLLERRISKLGLRLEGSGVEPLIRQLYDELSAHGLVFHLPLARSRQAHRAAERLRFSGSG